LIKLGPKAPDKSAPNSGKKKAKVVKKNDTNEENGNAAESDAENTTDQRRLHPTLLTISRTSRP
jgi:hypothetical protein